VRGARGRGARTGLGEDLARDAGRSIDAALDGGPDASLDAGRDAGRDSGNDAGNDGGTDAPVDRGCIALPDGCEPTERCDGAIDCPSPGDPRRPDTVPFADYALRGRDFYPGLARGWRWSVQGGPCDSLAPRLRSFELEGASSEVATFRPRLSGDYTITMEVVTLVDVARGRRDDAPRCGDRRAELRRRRAPPAGRDDRLRRDPRRSSVSRGAPRMRGRASRSTMGTSMRSLLVSTTSLVLSLSLVAPAGTALAVPPRGAGTAGTGTAGTGTAGTGTAGTGGTGAGGTDTSDPAGAEWRRLFELGRQHHEAGRFEDAAEAFYRAREAGGPASLLYNQGLSLDRLQRFDAALAAYRSYLDASPSAGNRAAVEARIAELEGASAPPQPGRLAPRIAPPSGPVMALMPLEGGFETIVVGEGRPVAHVEDPRPRVVETGPEWVASWFLLVGTLGAAGAAIGVWVDGQATFDAFRADCAAIGGCTQEEIDAASPHTSATVTNVLLVTTAVLGTATALSFLIEGVSTSGPRVYVDLGPGALRLRGSF
jgi:hypothetical protein